MFKADLRVRVPYLGQDLRVRVPCFYTTKGTCASAYHVFKADLRVRVPYLKEPLGRK
jgi:hypothetical protein